jgi:transposase
MGRSKGAIDEGTVFRARQEIERIKDSSLVIKLQAIISCGMHPVNLVASVLGRDRVTLWRWIRAFKEEGVSGLADKPKGHNPAKLNADQKYLVYQWIDEGKDTRGEATHWTLRKLGIEIEEEFGVKMTKTPLWLMVRAMGFRQKVPRRTHVLADKEKQEAFKKNL